MKRLLCAALAVLLAACLGGCARGEQPYDLDAQRIQADTEYLCLEIGDRVTGTAKEVEACDWLEEQLEEAGFSQEAGTLRRVPFQGLFELTSENLIAVCNPESDGPILCIMAHYDTVEGSPGARDNTSSVATLLEIARYLGSQRPELNAQVRLLFLGSEENGYHGASAYIQGLTQEKLARHTAAFNMENSAASPGPGAILVCGTVGGVQDGVYQEGNFLEPMENSVSQAASRAHQRLYGGEPLPTAHLIMSDHVIFHEQEIEAVNLNWRFFVDGLPTLPPQYHQPTDTPDGMDFDTAVVTGRCILAALEELAG